MSATPHQAVTGAYAPRTVGPTALASMTPPSAAAMFDATLKPAVRATALPIADPRSTVRDTCSRPGSACFVIGGWRAPGPHRSGHGALGQWGPASNRGSHLSSRNEYRKLL